MTKFPDVESVFLQQFLFSLQKRRKAIKYRFRVFNCQKVYEITKSERIEKIELTLRDGATQSSGTRFRFDLWPNRWVWADARKPSKKGWVWQWTQEGRLPPIFEGFELVNAIEASFPHSILNDEKKIQSYLDEVDLVWSPLLAKGPRVVR